MKTMKTRIVINDCIFDWRANPQKAVRIIEMTYKKDNAKYDSHIELIKGGYPDLKENKWVIDENILCQGSSAILSAYLKQPNNFKYPQKSPINPITPDFQAMLYQKLYETATPALVKKLFMEQFSSCEDIDISVEIYPTHGFLRSSGGLRACSRFVTSGRMKKRIGNEAYVLHGVRKQKDDESSGGFFLDGDVNNLKPDIILTENPQIKFVLAMDIPEKTRESLGKELLDLTPYFKGGVGELGYIGIKNRWVPEGPVNKIACEYGEDKDIEAILKGIRIIEKHGLSIHPTANGIYEIRLRP